MEKKRGVPKDSRVGTPLDRIGLRIKQKMTEPNLSKGNSIPETISFHFNATRAIGI